MTIVPEPAQKPLRRFEVVVGLLCLVVGGWLLAQVAFWVFGTALHLEIHTMMAAALLLVKSVYLLGFGGSLILRGYVSLLFWVIALAILVSIPATAGWFG